MSENKKYLKVEEKVFKTAGRIGYLVAFVFLGGLIMTVVNLLLYCLVDNYSLVKFLFTGEMKFSQWIDVMYKSYEFPYMRIGFFIVIFLIVGVYRSNSLVSKFKK